MIAIIIDTLPQYKKNERFSDWKKSVGIKPANFRADREQNLGDTKIL